nr:U2 small nuclear ribonucleoprotein auxiliary factor 35 kDa subunit-related protein 1-like isoform X1 [Misgurnus anguillicaudatus]
MAHKRFAQIPMSKRMRELCKEEDFAFLKSQPDQDQSSEESKLQESQTQKKLERDHRQEERQLKEQERQREIEEQKKVQCHTEKEEKWKSHVAELAVKREAIHAKLHRLREFRDFQKKVLLQDLDPGSTNETINHLLMRL